MSTSKKWQDQHLTQLKQQYQEYLASEPLETSTSNFADTYKSYWLQQKPSRKRDSVDHKVRDLIQKGRADIIPDYLYYFTWDSTRKLATLTKQRQSRPIAEGQFLSSFPAAVRNIRTESITREQVMAARGGRRQSLGEEDPPAPQSRGDKSAKKRRREDEEEEVEAPSSSPEPKKKRRRRSDQSDAATPPRPQRRQSAPVASAPAQGTANPFTLQVCQDQNYNSYVLIPVDELTRTEVILHKDGDIQVTVKNTPVRPSKAQVLSKLKGVDNALMTLFSAAYYRPNSEPTFADVYGPLSPPPPNPGKKWIFKREVGQASLQDHGQQGGPSWRPGRRVALVQWIAHEVEAEEGEAEVDAITPWT